MYMYIYIYNTSIYIYTYIYIEAEYPHNFQMYLRCMMRLLYGTITLVVIEAPTVALSTLAGQFEHGLEKPIPPQLVSP